MAAHGEVVDLRDEGRFVRRVDDEEAELVYRRRGDQLVLVHTGVPESLGGRGIGGSLVEAAVAWGEAEDLTLVPRCPYARRWLERHPEAAAGVRIEWPTADRPGGEAP